MHNRRFMNVLLILFLSASNSTTIFASASVVPKLSDSIQRSAIQPSVTINGINFSFQDELPTLIEGKTFVPTQLFEHPDIQADITKFIDNPYPHVFISHFNGALSIYPDKSDYMFSDYNEEIEDSDVWIDWKSPTPYLSGSDIMVPLRAIAERIGISVDWDVATRTAIITTDDDFRAELESPEEWDDWLGMKPIELDDPSREAITEQELTEFAILSGLPVLDSRIIDKYTAVLLHIEEEDGVESLTLKYVDRLKNGSLDWSMDLGMGDDGDDVQVKRSGQLVSVGMFDQGLKKQFSHFEVSYKVHDKRVTHTFDIAGKQGMFFDIPEEVTSGEITFFGKNGYTFETYFW